MVRLEEREGDDVGTEVGGVDLGGGIFVVEYALLVLSKIERGERGREGKAVAS